jgi:hypothetical protein
MLCQKNTRLDTKRLFLERKAAKLANKNRYSSQSCKLFIHWYFLPLKAQIKKYVNFYCEFPCFAGKIMNILSKRLVLEQRAAKLGIPRTALAAKEAKLFECIFVLCHKGIK